MGSFRSTSRKPRLFGLQSRVTRQIFQRVALVGGLIAVVLAAGEAFLAYERSHDATQSHIETIGRLIIPSLTKNVWELNTADMATQVDGLMNSSEVAAVRLAPANQPALYRENKQIAGNTFEVVFALRHTEEGKVYELGELTIIADRTARQEAAIWHAVTLAGAILGLVIFLAIIVTGIYQYLVISRLRGLALELEQITPDDLREFTEERTSFQSGDDEFDELTNGVLSLKRTGQRALYESDKKRVELETMNRAYQALSAVNQLVIEADNEQQLLDGACRIIRDDCGYLLVWIGLAQHDAAKSVLPVAETGHDDGYLSTINITWADSERGRGPTGTAIRESRLVIAKDIANNPAHETWREQALKRGYASSAAFPLQDGDTMYGALMIYSGLVDSFLDDEIALLKQLTSNVALGITKFRSEALRMVAEQALRESEQRFKDFSTASSDWFWETDGELRFTYFSDALKELFGMDSDALLGRRREDVASYDDLAHQAKWARHLHTLAERAPFRDFEYRVHTALGGRWLCISGVPVFGSDGEFKGYRGTGTDISERKRTENELIEARQAAESANVAKSRFLANMSHEIRTPMNGILGMAQLLLSNETPASERKDYARTILNAGRTLLALLNDILDLSKVEAGRLRLERAPFLPARLLNEMQSLFHESAHQKQLRLIAVWSGNSQDRYLGDSNRLSQMLSNLISNALKFTEQGQIDIRGTEVERHGRSAVLEFSVTDNGIGIPENKRDLLFKPFSQVDNSTIRKFGGTGLGLSIVSSLAQMMGGTIGVDSEPGKGSRFWFRIVAVAVSEGEGTEGEDKSRGQAETATSPLLPELFRGHVLVVDDDATNRKVAQAFLKALGASVSLAEDGKRGLEIIQSDASIDLVLMDVRMPVMDGQTATRAVRAWEAGLGKKHLPIIALTAGAFEEDRHNATHAGMNDFLTKPIELGALQKALGRWLPSVSVAMPRVKAEQTLDISRTQRILTRLIPLLSENSFAAIAEFRGLQEAVAGTRLEQKIALVGNPMDQLNFSLALMLLREIIQAENWKVQS